ncbi:hypothetical protein AB0G73_30730 [Streptomyces sp. NPDC020719]|uniref:hypothetical protein n=1 Tax=unclassified Streptomyces TaxID=2593676 RepID=UPI0033EA9AF1
MRAMRAMGRRRSPWASAATAATATTRDSRPSAPLAYDLGWAGEARTAGGCAAVVLGLLLLIDTSAGTLTAPRAALWLGLAALLLAVLWPARVSAGPGLLVSRTLTRTRAVRTDRLVSVRWSDGVAQRLLLRDADGNRAEIDPQVLVHNPPLWRFVDEGARTSVARGMLCCGETALRQVSARIDGETARAVFKVSGLG